MNNRIIKVSDAVELRDTMMAAENPEDVKSIAPFLKEEDVKGVKTSELKKVSAGYALPPYHFDCRSRTVVYREPNLRITKKGKTISSNKVTAADNLLQGLTEEETALWVNDMKRAASTYKFNKKDLKQDFKKHSKSFGELYTKEAYVKAAKQAIKEASKVRISNYNDEIMYNFFGKNGYVVLDRDMEIRGYYHQGDIAKSFERKGKLESYWYVLSNGK